MEGQLGTPTDAAAYPLRTFSVGADTMASQEKNTVTVTLRSDVLFASSEYTLSGKAAAAIDAAAAQIAEGAAGGKVTVVGHTDDVTDKKYTAQVVDVRRTDTGLVGTVRLAPDAADQVPVDALGDSMNGFAADRGFGLGNRALGSHELSLLVAGERLMPFDYEVPEGGSLLAGRRLLGDEALGFPIPQGGALLATAVRPDTGEDAVTVDVPGWFRVTDVPVSDG